jgi:hypothetical protein
VKLARLKKDALVVDEKALSVPRDDIGEPVVLPASAVSGAQLASDGVDLR